MFQLAVPHTRLSRGLCSSIRLMRAAGHTLDEMQAARERDVKTTGRELVQVVGTVVAQAFAQAYPDLHTVRYHERPYDATAFHHGKAAGGRVGLHPGVKGGTAPLQLRT